nr:uncharacterized protein LOC109151319 [Ipomoea batatas]
MDDAKQSLISGPMRMLDAHRSMAACRCELAIDDASPRALPLDSRRNKAKGQRGRSRRHYKLLVYYIDEELQKIYERVEFHDNNKELEVKSQKYASDRRKENQFGAINITAIEENQFGARYEEQYEMDYVIPEDELRSLSSDSETESAKPSLVYREEDVKKPMFQ